jgi:hypothetical protein
MLPQDRRDLRLAPRKDDACSMPARVVRRILDERLQRRRIGVDGW